MPYIYIYISKMLTKGRGVLEMNLDTSTSSPLCLPQQTAHRSRDCSWLDVLPPECDVLRDYQRIGLRQIAIEMHAGYRCIIRHAPTGSGKTFEIAALASAADSAGLSVLILATRTRLVKQLHERIDKPHGVIAAPYPELTYWNRRIQIASADTLYRRSLVDGRMALPSADLVIFDEGHLALGDSRLKILQQYPRARLVGFSATPAKISGRPLGALFERLIPGPSVRALIADGVLVKPRVFSVPTVEAEELAAVTMDSTTGDYAVGELSAVMRRERTKLTGDPVENWLRLANGKRTLAFGVDKAHVAQLVADFLRAGVPAEQLTDADDEAAREAAIARLERGETKVIASVFLMAYGIDIPIVECIQLARPTRSIVMYLQSVGRGMRAAPGKDSLIVLDHGRVVETLGMPTDEFHWSLKAGTNANRAALDRHSRRCAEEKARTCPDCHYVWLVSEEGPACRECGWKPAPRERGVRVSDAELVEMGSRPHRISAGSPFVEQFYRETLGWYVRRWPDRWSQDSKKGRWSSWRWTVERMKLAETERKPSHFWNAKPVPPSDSTSGWLKSRLIRYARGMAKAKKARAA